MYSILLLSSFLFVFFFTVIIVSLHRVKTRKQRRAAQEFRSRMETYSASSEENFIDPVVGSDPLDLAAPMEKKNNITVNKIDEAHPEIKKKQEDLPSNEKQEVVKKVFPHDLIVLMLKADADKPYVGYELLQALLAAGLRYGKMQIFHRYEQLNAAGQVLFSLASAVEPGTFELSKMGGFSSPCLTLFMRISAQKDAPHAFELMLDTAKQLVEDLGGEILDGNRTVLSDAKIIELRSRLAACEQAEHMNDLFVQAESVK